MFKSLAISETISKDILKNNRFKEQVAGMKLSQIEVLRYKIQMIIKEYNQIKFNNDTLNRQIEFLELNQQTNNVQMLKQI